MLASSDLKADLFHVVLFGPGYGESIAVRVPPDRWIIVDSLRFGAERNPALELLISAGARWSCLVLSHPHDDHAQGFPSLVDQGEGPLGLVAGYLMGVAPPDDLESIDKRHAVEAALAAIQT